MTPMNSHSSKENTTDDKKRTDSGMDEEGPGQHGRSQGDPDNVDHHMLVAPPSQEAGTQVDGSVEHHMLVEPPSPETGTHQMNLDSSKEHTADDKKLTDVGKDEEGPDQHGGPQGNPDNVERHMLVAPPLHETGTPVDGSCDDLSNEDLKNEMQALSLNSNEVTQEPAADAPRHGQVILALPAWNNPLAPRWYRDMAPEWIRNQLAPQGSDKLTPRAESESDLSDESGSESGGEDESPHYASSEDK